MATGGESAAIYRRMVRSTMLVPILFLMEARLTVCVYRLVPVPSSWPEARRFCREKHTELATVRHMDDQQQLQATLASAAASDGWIGLRGDGALTWRWSDGAGAAHYTAWREGEPNNVAGNEWCAAINSAGNWNDVPCEEENGVLCMERGADGRYRFVYDAARRSFGAAQQRCRQAHGDLATVATDADNRDAAALLGGGEDTWAWIGLFRDRFLWSSGNPGSFRFWPGGPRPGTVLNPPAAAAAAPGRWLEAPCHSKKAFVCEGGLKVRTVVVGAKLRAHADLSQDTLAAALLEKLAWEMQAAGLTDFKLSWRTYRSQPQEPHH